MILVTGATGNVASVLIPTLLQSGQQVQALVHDEAKAQGLRLGPWRTRPPGDRILPTLSANLRPR